MDRKTDSILSAIEEIRQDHRLYDIHAHPFNVATGDTGYVPSKEGLFSMGGRPYSSPDPAAIQVEDDPDPENKDQHDAVAPGLLRKMQLLSSRSLYAHTGPAVLGDQMRLSGIDRVLLLPVASPTETGDGQMEMMVRIFSDRKEYLFGYCVPNDVQVEKIPEAVGQAKRLYRAAAIKVHPNFTAIDTASDKGRERMHSILVASRIHGLPVVVHGGLSREFVAGEAAAYATLDRMSGIDWELTDKPVVIAHAGMFGYNADVATCTLMPVLSELMDRHANLHVDLSGLSSRVMKLVLGRTDTDRVLLGTDTLYFPQWLMVLRMYLAVTKLFEDGPDRFVAIASRNPERCFFN